MASNGSVQGFQEIPEDIRKLYRTVWEIPQRVFINLAAGRGPFIDQSQSLNIYMSSLSFDKISNMHFYGWKCGLKTGKKNFN
jgi:ribonucleotide reductase alpha subunit